MENVVVSYANYTINISMKINNTMKCDKGLNNTKLIIS